MNPDDVMGPTETAWGVLVRSVYGLFDQNELPATRSWAASDLAVRDPRVTGDGRGYNNLISAYGIDILNWTISFELALRVSAGYIGTFLVFPLAIAGRKGSPWHRLVGRVFVGAFVVICLAGYLLDRDEILGLNVCRSWGSPNLMPSI